MNRLAVDSIMDHDIALCDRLEEFVRVVEMSSSPEQPKKEVSNSSTSISIDTSSLSRSTLYFLKSLPTTLSTIFPSIWVGSYALSILPFFFFVILFSLSKCPDRVASSRARGDWCNGEKGCVSPCIPSFFPLDPILRLNASNRYVLLIEFDSNYLI